MLVARRFLRIERLQSVAQLQSSLDSGPYTVRGTANFRKPHPSARRIILPSGGETRLKLFVRGLTPLSAAAPAVRFETTPGHQMQADWATVGRGADRLSLFIATLGWSRQAYVEFCDDERVETLIGCHETAFLTFGGVPIEILYDNLWTSPAQGDPLGRRLECTNLSGL
jgi:transposase